MKKDREIGALDMAIVRMVETVENTLILAMSSKAWIPIWNGLDIVIQKEEEEEEGSVFSVHVLIRPIGWPGSSTICCRFVNLSGEARSWNIISGRVEISHIDHPLAHFSFSYHRGGREQSFMDFIKASDESDDEIKRLLDEATAKRFWKLTM